MLENIIPRHSETMTEYRIEFTDEDGNGLSFNATPDGKIIIDDDNEAAKANYAYAMEHPDEYARFNVFTSWKHNYTEPAKGTCKCGNTVILENQYCGACQCDNCGQWYNLFGQELISPEYWED